MRSRKKKDLYGTHHVGASTDQAQEAIAAETVRIVSEFKETGKVPNVVNLARQTPATHRSGRASSDRPGVLARVLEAIKAEQINVQEMENIVFEGAAAAVARINLDNAPSRETLEKLQAGNADIIELDLLELSEAMNTTLITGASRGIGEAFARKLAARGRNVLLVARSEDKLITLCNELGRSNSIRAQYVALDLQASLKRPSQLFEETEKRELEIDMLINNAGFGSMGDFSQTRSRARTQDDRTEHSSSG